MPAKSKTAVHPASKSKKGDPCYFEKLPAELQIIICDYAYGNENSNLYSKGEILLGHSNTSNVNRTNWNRRLRGRSAFEHTVNQFLVSKAFLSIAIEVFLSKKTIVRKMRQGNSDLFDITSIQRYVRSAHIYDFRDIQRLLPFSRLKKLKISVWILSSDKKPSDSDWLRDFNDEDLASLRISKEFQKLSAHQVAISCVLISPWLDWRTSEENRTRARNILALEKYLNKPL